MSKIDNFGLNVDSFVFGGAAKKFSLFVQDAAEELQTIFQKTVILYSKH